MCSTGTARRAPQPRRIFIPRYPRRPRLKPFDRGELISVAFFRRADVFDALVLLRDPCARMRPLKTPGRVPGSAGVSARRHGEIILSLNGKRRPNRCVTFVAPVYDARARGRRVRASQIPERSARALVGTFINILNDAFLEDLNSTVGDVSRRRRITYRAPSTSRRSRGVGVAFRRVPRRIRSLVAEKLWTWSRAAACRLARTIGWRPGPQQPLTPETMGEPHAAVEGREGPQHLRRCRPRDRAHQGRDDTARRRAGPRDHAPRRRVSHRAGRERTENFDLTAEPRRGTQCEVVAADKLLLLLLGSRWAASSCGISRGC